MFSAAFFNRSLFAPSYWGNGWFDGRGALVDHLGRLLQTSGQMGALLQVDHLGRLGD